jgi:divalent metal cation (Fe/Co/Zn/Cd) transporter
VRDARGELLRSCTASAPTPSSAAARSLSPGSSATNGWPSTGTRSGKRIGSVALVADGCHTHVDGFTSLAVVVGVAGVDAGFELADPIVGIAISLVILRIVWQSLRTIGPHAMDGVEPGTIDTIARSARAVDGVRVVTDVRARWLGHGIEPS